VKFLSCRSKVPVPATGLVLTAEKLFVVARAVWGSRNVELYIPKWNGNGCFI